MVLLFLSYLVTEEAVIVIAGAHCRRDNMTLNPLQYFIITYFNEWYLRLSAHFGCKNKPMLSFRRWVTVLVSADVGRTESFKLFSRDVIKPVKEEHRSVSDVAFIVLDI